MPLTIVMYHYVRDLVRTRYPAVKGRDLDEFRHQLNHIDRHYTVVSAEAVMAAAQGQADLPSNAAWLTFDDGYSDHYDVVFPMLHERGWQGSFFPPGAVLGGELLDVNRVHFVLAAQPDPAPIIERIAHYLRTFDDDEELRSFADYWNELAQASRFDSAEIIFIKRLLQHGLPELHRRALAEQLFVDFVSVEPATFAAELYLTADQLRTMIRCGMYVGSHGNRHYWLDRLRHEELVDDIDASLECLRALGAPTDRWVMCYPYGAHDDAVGSVLRERGCVVGLTTQVGVADLGVDDPLKLPRLDTNDLPVP